MIRLTDEAHAAVREVLGTGEIAIDATAGNGCDTRFLADLVGPTGRVYAFDVQADALTRTMSALPESSGVTLIHGDHAEMLDAIPPELHGRVGAVMFNLGYLPSGDHSVVTRPESTAVALRAALQLLRPGGVLTTIAYPGHPGGLEELMTVRDVLARTAMRELTPSGVKAPTLFVVRR